MKLHRILLIGLVTRILVIPFFAHPFDVYAWYTICESIIQKGPYVVSYFPPMLFYTFIPIAYLYQWASTSLAIKPTLMSSLPTQLNPYPQFEIEYVPGPIFNILAKIPFLLADILLAILLYKLVSGLGLSQSRAEKAAAIWFLNPYLIWISSGWGMFDSLPALFTIASLYFFSTKRLGMAGACLAVGVAYKLYPIVFLFPVALYFLKGSSNRRIELIKFFSIFLIVSAVLFFPAFGGTWSLSQSLVTGIYERAGLGLTYWSILLTFPSDFQLVSYLSTILVVLAIVIVCFLLRRLEFENKIFDLSAASLSLILAVFLSYRIICEQFFVWALPFLIISCIEGRTEEILYRASSILALLYSVTNLLFPFFLLPIAPWASDMLLAIISALGISTPKPGAYTPRLTLGTGTLGILGTAFSILMLVTVIETLVWPRKRIVKTLLPRKLNELLLKLRIQVE